MVKSIPVGILCDSKLEECSCKDAGIIYMKGAMKEMTLLLS